MVGNLNISSTPLGAEIYIDIIDTGFQTISPHTTIINIANGVHQLTLTLSGYEDYNKEFTINEGQITTIDVTLTPIPPTPPCQIQAGYFTKNGNMLQAPVCSATSSDKVNVEAVVNFSSNSIGKKYKCELKISGPGLPSFSFFTPLVIVTATETFTSQNLTIPIPVGTYTVLDIVVYDSSGNTVCSFVPTTGVAGSPCNIVTITSSVGSIKFISTPPGAEIFIDNTDQKQVTPYQTNNVPAGTHSYKLTLAKYPNITGTVVVPANGVAQVSVNFITAQATNTGLIIVGTSIVAVVIGGIVYLSTRGKI
jgi:hypothetical protein